jgi:hypothetical protein
MRSLSALRFWERAEVTASGCLVWRGNIDRAGYGRYGQRRASRVAWELGRGPIPEGIYVCHHCDNPACINLDHLFLGTQKDNIADCISKGRQSPPPVSHPASLAALPEARAASAARTHGRACLVRPGVVHAPAEGCRTVKSEYLGGRWVHRWNRSRAGTSP